MSLFTRICGRSIETIPNTTMLADELPLGSDMFTLINAIILR